MYRNIIHGIRLQKNLNVENKVYVSGYVGVKQSEDLGRVYTVHLKNFECYYLRLLLHNIKDPTCFNDLKIINGQICESYREACQKRGLLEDDNHWDNTMNDAKLTEIPAKIRFLFIILLSNCEISNPKNLWEKYKFCMAEDILYQSRHENKDLNIDFNDEIFN